MGAQDRTEQVLRDIYILLAGSETYRGETNRIIVDKKEMVQLLNRLNTCIYEIMEEHELTVQSRNAAERQVRRRSDEIVADAGQMAEDVYAASILYTDEALRNVQGIMQEASDAVRGIYEKMDSALKEEKQKISRDQSALKSNLADLKDTQKYLNLIEDRNRQIAREKAKKERESRRRLRPMRRSSRRLRSIRSILIRWEWRLRRSCRKKYPRKRKEKSSRRSW